MVNETSSHKPRRFWPGMPTPTSKVFEVVFGFFPGLIAIVGVSIALLLPMVQSCRDFARKHAGQAPPQNAEQVE